ncbi:MAG: dicarboxylate/amino acid:cation symporter [Duodenibacillus sp.]|nr:dicarboxylate/amino acid:cation symporter [Duodenibacillus sp.]
MGAAYALAIALGVVVALAGFKPGIAVADFFASTFVRLFKFVSIPVISLSIIGSLAVISDSSRSGRIFRRTIFYTLLTTILAALLAAALYLAVGPGNVSAEGAKAVAGLTQKSYLDYITSVVPDNVFAPFVSANVLSVLMISMAVGLAIACMKPGKHKELLQTFFQGMQEVCFTLVRWLLVVLPLGIFGFIAQFVMEVQAGVQVGGIVKYFTVVLVANFVQMLVVLPAILLVKGINPLKVARAMSPALAVAFFSKSSAATLPVTINSAETRAGVSPEVSRFVLPICTTINMNGCAAFILVTVVYLMQNAGVEVGAGTMLVWVLIATLAAVGNAGVPMGCFFLSASLVASMGLPITLMGVILPVYAVIDMIETTLNVWSDSTVSVMVDQDMKKAQA